MNRFDYFSDIEEKFVELRGSHLLLSNLDWQLIEQWKTDGVPLPVVLRAIEEVFRNHKAKERRRPIASLSYCKSEVEAQFAEYNAGRIGAHEETGGSKQEAEGRNPFPKAAVLAYLRQQRVTLLEGGTADAWILRSGLDPDFLLLAFRAAGEKLTKLENEIEGGAKPQQVEEVLKEIERNLDQTIALSAGPSQIAEARAAAEALYIPYKSNMLPQVYDQQIDNELKKRLRAIFGVPRLSLFHMMQ